MRYLKKLFSCILLLSLLTLAGCGGSSGGTEANPFDPSSSPLSGGGEASITLTTASTSYDINDGSVLATAKFLRNGVPVPGVSVTFNIVAPTNGPATIENGLDKVSTDTNGVAVTRITTGSVLSTTNVIIQASVSSGTQPVSAIATFQLVPTLLTQPAITLATDRSSYDANTGTAVATVKIIRNGAAVSDAPVTYAVLSGSSFVTTGYKTPTTDKNGISIATFTLSKPTATSTAIIRATSTIDDRDYTAYAQFEVVGNDPTLPAAPTVNMTLTADRTQVDVNNGTVMLNANLIFGTDVLKSTGGAQSFIASGSYIADQAVTFKVIAPIVTPAIATISGSELVTDKNGNSKAILTTGNSSLTTNVIIEASTSYPNVGGKIYRAYTTIQIVRGGGVIMFTSAASATPGGQTNMLTPYEATLKAPPPASVNVLQLIPFKLTDSNGNPRVGVPVTLSVYSVNPTSNSSEVTIDFLTAPITEPNQTTITSDSAGMGIFNVRTNITSPLACSFTAKTVVFKAVTNDVPPVTAYVGRDYALTTECP